MEPTKLDRETLRQIMAEHKGDAERGWALWKLCGPRAKPSPLAILRLVSVADPSAYVRSVAQKLLFLRDSSERKGAG